tara:strand:+ start:3556 stop:3855 length:300 start_codon:yes stop_codon:yes gene_type:complete
MSLRSKTDYKNCSNCGKSKPTSSYYTKGDRLSSSCKECELKRKKSVRSRKKKAEAQKAAKRNRFEIDDFKVIEVSHYEASLNKNKVVSDYINDLLRRPK